MHIRRKRGNERTYKNATKFGMVMLLLGMMTGCGECEHEYNDEEITKEATCSEERKKIITCENCGYSYTEPIPVRDDEVVVSVTDKSNLPQDADACRRRILKCILLQNMVLQR